MTSRSSPFSLLTCLYPDDAMSDVWSPESLVKEWVRFEHALARAQAEAGVISDSDCAAICEVGPEAVDLAELWPAARNVGYPVLPLVRQMAAKLPEGPNGRVHYGATTQDVMDTGLVLALRDSCDLLLARLESVGDRMARLVEQHAATVMPGRTHGQQAVPTTFGAQLAPALSELARTRPRIRQARDTVAVVSLFGAGGTSAALGTPAREIRASMAEELGLATTDVPWHSARDAVVAVSHAAQLTAGTCARLARNVIDLSRTEIGELHEAAGTHRGASSTMPQKANPILAEGIVGMSAVIGPLVGALSRALEVPQERAAGEWQIEWHVLPQIMQLTAGCLTAADELLAGLRVDTDVMRSNLDRDGGLIMAEAIMIALAGALGREVAHDTVYAAALEVRSGTTSLPDAVRNQLRQAGHDVGAISVPTPEDYLGDTSVACTAAVAAWQEDSRLTDEETPI